jgi:amidase
MKRHVDAPEKQKSLCFLFFRRSRTFRFVSEETKPKRRHLLAASLAAFLLAAHLVSAQEALILDKDLATISADLQAGHVTSEQLVAAYEARIASLDAAGPALHAVIALNPRAMDDARALDAERRAHGARGPLHGVPLLIKDNIETLDPVPTTAGSLALAGNLANRDAPVIARLRKAGAIILGKTNLSEWANMRGSRAVSGWSGVGGLTRNPFSPDRSSCGSSSGSGAAIAADFAAAALGTETDGSVVCPSSVNGLAGLKPTLGLVSRTHVVPISHSQDTPGPMAHSVRDLALLLTAMAGTDPADPATAPADAHRTDYADGLDPKALRGARIGVLRFEAGFHPETDAVFEKALATIRRAGATLVDIDRLPGADSIGDAEFQVLLTELKADLNAYLATTPPGVKTRTLADLIAFNRDHGDRELGLFGQELFEKAQTTTGLDDPSYRTARGLSQSLAGEYGIDKLLADDNVIALVAPTAGPAWVVDTVNGDHSSGQTSTLPAVAGYPHLTVPMGDVSGLPVGLSFIGPAWSEKLLLNLGYAFEQANAYRPRPGFAPVPKTGSLTLPAAP